MNHHGMHCTGLKTGDAQRAVGVWACLLSCLLVTPGRVTAEGKGHERKPDFVPTSAYETRTIEGWTVHVNRDLLGERTALGEMALRLLEVKLYDIGRTVPEAACRELRKVPIWLGIDDGHAPCAEYHPSREWLRTNGYNPEKAESVELGNAQRFVNWSRDQPSMVLHELAHAYHHQVLGYDHQGVREAYQSAVNKGQYNSILHFSGTQQRAYAMTNVQEYFAETTEAYFGTNDMYPFVRAELRELDPHMAEVLDQVWTAATPGRPASVRPESH